MGISQLPNLLTLLRIAAAPALILLLREQEYRAALAVFFLAGVSDGLDGYIAKRFHCTSRLGAILDPIADKTLLVSSYVMLAWLDKLPFWLVLAVASRDALIVGGYLVYTSLYGQVEMRPSVFSKINTLVQIALVVVMLVELALPASWPLLTQGLIYAVLVTTVGSGLHYVWIWGVLKEIKPADNGKSTRS
jgi:cardiolipin synthase